MFEDSLVESNGSLSKRNPWTAALSFAMQGLLAGGLVLLPIIYTEALPGRPLRSILTEPPRGLSALVSTHAHPVQPQPTLADQVLRVPNWIPRRVAVLHDQPTDADGVGAPDWIGVPGGTGTGASNSVIRSVIQIPAAMPKVVAPAKVRVSSGVAQGLLIHETKPVYPSLAMQARIQGTVLLQAVVAKDGTVQDLRVVSGHPLLVKAALDAVKRWRYKPYRLNDEPVEVETEIIVNFTLDSR